MNKPDKKKKFSLTRKVFSFRYFLLGAIGAFFGGLVAGYWLPRSAVAEWACPGTGAILLFLLGHIYDLRGK